MPDLLTSSIVFFSLATPPILYLQYMATRYTYELLVVTPVVTLSRSYPVPPPRTRKTLPLFILARLLLPGLLVTCTPHKRKQKPLPMILYFPLNLCSYSSYTHLDSHYIFLAFQLIPESAG